MANGLEHLLSEGIVSEVLGRLKSGKEADVYAVQFGGRVVAAKVYKDRAHRSFKNNSAYQEGRSVRNSRSQRAMDRKTSFGQASAEAAWKSAEADALYKLHGAEVRVPAPVLFLEGVLLMELVLDETGEPAPRLVDATISPAEARVAYHDMLTQLVRILSCDLIHGDLSPYNVLWGAQGPTIIDFPQIVSASHNSSSEAFFLRDAKNILGFFAAIDKSLQARSGDAQEIWRAYVRRELTPDFVPLGRAQSHAPARAPGGSEGTPRPGAHRDGRARPPPQQSGHPGAARSPSTHGNSARARPAQGGAPSGLVDSRRPAHGNPTPDRAHANHRSNGAAPRQDRAHPHHRAGGQAGSHGSPRRPPMPEVIVRIARTPRATPEANLREEPKTASEPRTADASRQGPRSRG